MNKGQLKKVILEETKKILNEAKDTSDLLHDIYFQFDKLHQLDKELSAELTEVYAGDTMLCTAFEPPKEVIVKKIISVRMPNVLVESVDSGKQHTIDPKQLEEI